MAIGLPIFPTFDARYASFCAAARRRTIERVSAHKRRADTLPLHLTLLNDEEPASLAPGASDRLRAAQQGYTLNPRKI